MVNVPYEIFIFIFSSSGSFNQVSPDICAAAVLSNLFPSTKRPRKTYVIKDWDPFIRRAKIISDKIDDSNTRLAFSYLSFDEQSHTGERKCRIAFSSCGYGRYA